MKGLIVKLALMLAIILPCNWAFASDYIVQVSSVSTQEAAIAESDRLLAKGVPSFQTTENIPERGTVHRVYVGPFATKAEADAAAQALKSSGIIKDFVVREDTRGVTPAAPTAPATQPAEAPTTSAAAPPAVQPTSPMAGPPASAPLPPVPQGQASAPLPQVPMGPPIAATPVVPPEGMDSVPVLQPSLETPIPSAVPTAELPGGGYGSAPRQGPGGENWGATLPQQPSQVQTTPQAPGTVPGGQDDLGWPIGPTQPQVPTQNPTGDQQNSNVAPGWPTPPSVLGTEEGWPVPQEGSPTRVDPGETVYWTDPANPNAGSTSTTANPPPTQNQGWIPPGGGLTQAGQASAAPPVLPGGYGNDDKLNGFAMLVDLSVGMQKESPCMGHLIKNEAATKLIRKIVQRVPASPITASLRVFGYKYGLTEADNTALYYEPSTFNRRNFEHTLMRLMPSNSIANFSQGIGVLMEDLGQMDSPRGALLFSDFSVAKNSGDPPGQAKRLIDLFGPENRIFTFYLTDDEASIDLARRIAAAGGGVSYNVCELLENPDFLEVALEDIFGSNLLIPCQDTDKDGVCDDNDTCPGTPLGAPVDGRGCWIAAYSYFFDYDKTAVKAAFHPRVEYAAQIMLSNPQPPSVVISGYTDSQGTELYNLDLGKKRAESIRNLLIKFGVPAELLTVQSYGKSNPIADNSTEEGRAMNRRVEFTIANP